MHTRERGAAHINIFFFLVMLVLFLGALGFGYVQLTENQEIVAQNQSLRAQTKEATIERMIRDHYIEDIRKVIGEADTYAGREGFNYDVPPTPLENVTSPAKVRSLMVAFASEAGIAESLVTSLSSVLSQAKAQLDSRDKRIADLEQQLGVLGTQVSVADASVNEANTAKQREVADLKRERDDLRQTWDAEFTKLKGQIAGLRSEVRSRDENLDNVQREHRDQVLTLSKEIQEKRARIIAQAQLTKLINPPQEPDGEVISASQAASRAWIDVGRKDMLPRGTVFRITDPKGKLKARGRVIAVDADRAELEVYDLADRFDPVVKGDKVANDLYSPRVRRNIYLMGRFPYPLNKPTVKVILERLGNKVHDEIGPGIDLVVVGLDTLNEEKTGFVPVTDSEDYKTALNLGIEIATMNKIRDFLEVGE